MSNTFWDELFFLLSIDIDSPISKKLMELANERQVLPGEVITQQFHPAGYLYFVVEGRVKLSVKLEGELGEFDLGTLDERFFPLGWSGLSQPHRYATTASAAISSHLIFWSINELEALFVSLPNVAERLYAFMLNKVIGLCEQTRNQLQFLPERLEASNRDEYSPQSSKSLTESDIKTILSQSLFFEPFSLTRKLALASAAISHQISKGKTLCQQGDIGDDGLYILAKGEMIASFNRSGDDIFLRSYNTPGQILFHPALTINQAHNETLIARNDTLILRIALRDLETISEIYSDFFMMLIKRLLWLVGARLKNTRAHVLAQRYEEERTAIAHLLNEYSPKLAIDSDLYKIPHLLANRMTHQETFTYLDKLQENGSKLERILSGVFLDLLGDVRREANFYRALYSVYDSVVNAPKSMKVEEVRYNSIKHFQTAFEETRYVIKGRENLPNTAGNIFILNHLISHPYNTLPNGFELALDTHFVSAMILEPKYGDGGVRVVRKGRAAEYGHHFYYDRLSHIYVYTDESDAVHFSKNSYIQQRELFYQTAEGYLREGKNLVICPEGTSRWSNMSPDVFKAGAFRLAAKITPEPWIIPIAVVNFDKRVKKNALAAVIEKPFKISDVTDPNDRASLSEFLNNYRHTFRSYIQHAETVAKQAMLN